MKTAGPGRCVGPLPASLTAEYIANAEAQRVQEAVKEIRPPKKDLRHLGKGIWLGLWLVRASWTRRRSATSRTEEAARRQRRQLAQRSPPPSHLSPSPSPPSAQQGLCAQQPAPPLVPTTPCLHSLPVRYRTTRILNPSYLLLPPTGNTAPAPLQLTQYRKKSQYPSAGCTSSQEATLLQIGYYSMPPVIASIR